MFNVTLNGQTQQMNASMLRGFLSTLDLRSLDSLTVTHVSVEWTVEEILAREG